MKLVALRPSHARALDRAFKGSQPARPGTTETDLVRALAAKWKSTIEGVLQSRLQGVDVVGDARVIHATPIVGIIGVQTQQDPELGDLLLVTGYTRGDLLHRGRAVFLQAKGPKTPTPSHQLELYRNWRPFRMIKPSYPRAMWDVGPEGVSVPPSRRGSAFLDVERGRKPIRIETGRTSQKKSLGECVRVMLRLRYSRAFSPVDPDPSGRNSWDQLVTHVLQRADHPGLRPFVGPPPKGLGKGKRLEGSGGVVRTRGGGSTASSRRTPSQGEDQRDLHVVFVIVREED